MNAELGVLWSCYGVVLFVGRMMSKSSWLLEDSTRKVNGSFRQHAEGFPMALLHLSRWSASDNNGAQSGNHREADDMKWEAVSVGSGFGLT